MNPQSILQDMERDRESARLHPDEFLSSATNAHVLRLQMDGSLVLMPGPKILRWCLACFLLLAPTLLWLCWHYHAPWKVWLSAVLFPVFAGGGFLIGHIGWGRCGTRARFDPLQRTVTISGWGHPRDCRYHFDEIVAVETRTVRSRQRFSSFWGYQLNLRLRDGRCHNLLGGYPRRSLNRMADRLAEFLGVERIRTGRVHLHSHADRK